MKVKGGAAEKVLVYGLDNDQVGRCWNVNRAGIGAVRMPESVAPPADFIYQYFKNVSGPSGAADEDMNVAGSLATPGIFEYEVPVGRVAIASRINLGIEAADPKTDRFGNIAVLANGVLLQVIDNDGSTVLLDLAGGRPLQANRDFTFLAGVDMTIEITPGMDMVKVRFSIFKAGIDMQLTAGQRVRFTIRDDISALSTFRAMLQGNYTS